MNEQYIQNGLVRIGYWHFAFLGNESLRAAEASECAAEQDAFCQYHDILYESQSGENRVVFSTENLKLFAAQLGLDTLAFNECLDSGKYSDQVLADTQAAQQIGVQNTPSFLINGQPVIGAQSFEVFQRIIDTLLAEG
ncbi:MAG: thioredoxin domain-containing protein [Anaerolineae bacterium]|nr:thioredoxin domain-containing protein [Anaerolineae bacterium]